MAKPKTPKWTKEEIRANMLLPSPIGDAWLIRGMFAILGNQTPDEQAMGQTVEDNGLGFNGVDAEILTSFCGQAQMRLTALPANDPTRYSRCLTPKQLEIARKLMLKYCGQLAAHANIYKPKVVA